MSAFFKAAPVLAALTALLAVSGCREAEQGRPLVYEKGVYQGQPDEEIDEETRRELRERVKHQSFDL